MRKKWHVSLSKLSFNLHFSKDYCEKAMAPHSSTLAWKIPWTEEPCGLQSMGSWRVGHNWETSLSLFIFLHWRRNGNPPQCSCLRIPGTAEPGGLPSMGSHRVGHNWSDLAVAKTTDVEHLLIYLLAFHTSIYVLYPFFNWVVFYAIELYEEIAHTFLDTSHLSDILFAFFFSFCR